MRVLFSFAGGRGHLDPLIPIARAAAEAGHEVAVSGGHTPLQAAAELGLATLPVGSPPSGKPRERLPLLEVDLERNSQEIRERFIRRHARWRALAAIALYEEWQPHVVVCDEFDFGSAIAAERLGLPHATVVVSAAGSMIRPDVVAEPLDELRAEHGLPADPQLAMLALDRVFSPFPVSFRNPAFALPGTAVAFRAIEVEVRPGQPPWPVRRADAPTVYFTLGTEFNVESGDLFSRVLAGLRELPVNIVVTVGSDIDPDELGPQPDHVHVARFIPHAAVLAHVDAVVSHGGSGSVLGALAHGLPQVLVAMGADQPLNAARVERLGLGRTLDPVRATPDDVREAVAAVLSDPGYRTAAESMRGEIEAMPPPAAAVAALEGLAAE